MNTLFEVKIKTLEEGKKVSKSYLVEAATFTDVEVRMADIMVGYDFKITNIRPTNYAEIFEDSVGEKWFKVKVSLVGYDEDSGKEKKTNTYFIVKGEETKEALENTSKIMKGTLGDWEISAISETLICEVYKY
jgi:hypothetical protein